MFDRVTEQHEIHADDAGSVVVLFQHILHVLLQFVDVGDVFVHEINAQAITEDRWLFVGADVVEGLVKELAKLLAQDLHEGLPILIVHKAVREHAEVFVDPKTRDGVLGIMIVLVGSQHSLEDLKQDFRCSVQGTESFAFQDTLSPLKCHAG